MILHTLCPVCKKRAVETSRDNIAGLEFVNLICGHSYQYVPLSARDVELISEDGAKPYPFQVKGAIQAIEKGNCRVLICDEMGLGKTVQALMIVKSQNFKWLQVGKASLKIQWMKEAMRWTGDIAQIIEKEKHYLLPTKGYILSIDMLYRFKDLEGWIKNLAPDVVIIDECQTVKNHDSQRTNALRKIVAHVPYIIALSGTPIKNHAGEYFPILNMINPEKFSSLVGYQRNWVDVFFDARNGKYKYGGIKDPAKFQEYTKDFIIRRTRAEVNDEIRLTCGTDPRRTNRFSELGKVVNDMYQRELKEFVAYYYDSTDSAFEKQSNILARMSRLRHLTGTAKVTSAIDYIGDFLIEQERDRKFCLFCHHDDVMDLIIAGLENIQKDWPSEFGNYIAQIRGSYNSQKRNDEVQKFSSPDCRIMIASTLAAGEGLNLQFCSDYGILEREWNPANEEQAEGRFIRIGQKAEVVNGTYFIATGTIDEIFAELVERKRGIMKNTLDGINYKWEETNIMKELADALASSGKDRFTL